MPRVLMNFQKYRDYTCHFIKEDCRSPIGPHTRFYNFATLEELDAFFQRCHPDDPDELLHDMRRWGKGSAWCNLTNEQYRQARGGQQPEACNGRTAPKFIVSSGFSSNTALVRSPPCHKAQTCC